MSETWAPIEGTSGRYEISNTGKVKSFARLHPRILKAAPDQQGYLYVHIRFDGGYKRAAVSRLVAKAFLDSPSNPMANEVNHIDCNKANNTSSNLEWVTKQENIRHARQSKRWKPGSALAKTPEARARSAAAGRENLMAYLLKKRAEKAETV